MSDKKLTIDEVIALVKNVLISENNAFVYSAEPSSDGDYCLMVIEGDVSLKALKAIAKAVGDEPIIGGEESNQINLFFRIPTEDEVNSGDDDDDDESEEDKAPRIPENMRHDEEYYDSKDVVIPGTEMNCSNTEQCEKIKAWMKETSHIPIVYIRLSDGLHVEVSDIYDRKAKDVLTRDEVVGNDGRKYKLENPDNLFPIGSSICVRATCIETGRNDVYGLDFFV
jgi:hypothetical protein